MGPQRPLPPPPKFPVHTPGPPPPPLVEDPPPPGIFSKTPTARRKGAGARGRGGGGAEAPFTAKTSPLFGENALRAKGAENASCGEMVVQKGVFGKSTFFAAPLRFAQKSSETLEFIEGCPFS